MDLLLEAMKISSTYNNR